MTRQIGGRTVTDGRALNGSTALDEQGAHSPATTIADVSQIPGIRIAHHTDEENGTGCTVIVCPAGATGAVDVRGGAPATRETDLLRPEETVDVLHAVVLSGGSAYGLAASVGVAEELERRGIGLDVQVGVVPIVSGACLFDLAFANPNVRPTAADGARACALALDNAPHSPATRQRGRRLRVHGGKARRPHARNEVWPGHGRRAGGTLAVRRRGGRQRLRKRR